MSRILATTGLLWCVIVSCWIWVSSIRSSGVAWSSVRQGAAASDIRTIPIEETRTFANVSTLGPLPLIIPVLLAATATWGAWRDKTTPLLVSTVALLAFCFVTGFSIGSGYLLGGGALVWALFARLSTGPTRSGRQ